MVLLAASIADGSLTAESQGQGPVGSGASSVGVGDEWCAAAGCCCCCCCCCCEDSWVDESRDDERECKLAPVITSATNKHTHTHPFNGPFPGLPRWAGIRKVKPIWILLKQETVSGSGISWAVCKFAPRSRQITTPVFYRPDALPAAQPTVSKHRRQSRLLQCFCNKHWDSLSFAETKVSNFVVWETETKSLRPN